MFLKGSNSRYGRDNLKTLSSLCDKREEEINMLNAEKEGKIIIENKSNNEILGPTILSDFEEFMKEPTEESLKNIKIIFDSGSTSHICSEIWMFDLIEERHGVVYLPDKNTYEYYGRGKIGFLNDVLWVPKLSGIYISCGKFDDEGMEIRIKHGILQVIDNNGFILCQGIKDGGLYHFDQENDEYDQVLIDDQMEIINEINVQKGSAPRRFKNTRGIMKEIDYLHHRWGHLNEEALKEGIRRGTIHGILVDPEVVLRQTLSFCPDCIKGKMKELPSRLSEKRYDLKEPMQVLHSDSKGPFSVRSWQQQYRYFELYLFIPSYYIIIKFKRLKDEFYENFQDVMKEVEKIGHQVKFFQTDDEDIYSSKKCRELLDLYKLNKRTSTPHHHQSNGMAERYIQRIMNIARTIMLIYDCPLKLWSYAIEYASDLHNRSPIKELDWKTPYEIIFGEIPDISDLNAFYSPGLIYLSKEERAHSLSARALEGRFIGLDKKSKNGAIFYIPELGKTIRSVNYRLLEQIDLEKNYGEDENRDVERFKTLNYDQDDPKIQEFSNFFEEDLHPEWMDDLDSDEEILSYLSEDEEELNTLASELELPDVPLSINEALSGPDADNWEKAIDDEIQQLNQYQALKPCTPSVDENIAKMKLVLETKFDNDMKIKYKARLVLCGYSQVYGVDFVTTYSPTIGRDSFRIAILYILTHKMYRGFFDFKSAFIEGLNDFRIIGQMPPELFPAGTPPQYVEVVRSLYGEKQAAYIWYEKLSKILCENMGFDKIMHDEAMFVKKNKRGEIRMILVVYVDDLLIGSYFKEEQEDFLIEIRKYVRKVTKYENVKKYLGVEILDRGNTIYLSQVKYIESIVNELQDEFKFESKGMEDFPLRIKKIPMSPGHDIGSKTNPREHTESFSMISEIGKLRYIADNTRFDIMTTLGVLSEGASSATEKQKNAIYDLVNFLYTTRGLSLKLRAELNRDLKLFAFCDASHNISNGKSRLGGVFYLGYESGPISCFSKKDTTTSNSTMESEIRAIDRTIRQIIIYRNLLEELGHKQMEPTVIYTDSESSVKFFKHYRNSKKLRHIMKLIHMIRHAINQRIIKLVYIKAEYNVADIMTKIVTRSLFEKMQIWILNGYNEFELKKYLVESGSRERVDAMEIDDNPENK